MSLGRVDGRAVSEVASQDGAAADDRERTNPLAEGMLEGALPVAEAGLQRRLVPRVPENLRGVREGEKGYEASDEALEAPAEAVVAAAAVAAAVDLDEGVEDPCAVEASWEDPSLLLEPLEDEDVFLEAAGTEGRRLPRRRWRRRLASLVISRLSHSDGRGPRL